jgi:hypothetical protein
MKRLEQHFIPAVHLFFVHVAHQKTGHFGKVPLQRPEFPLPQLVVATSVQRPSPRRSYVTDEPATVQKLTVHIELQIATRKGSTGTVRGSIRNDAGVKRHHR